MKVTSGVAAFSECKIDLKGDGYVLEAVAGGLNVAETQPFSVRWAGDVNNDCRVGVVDFSRVVTHFGKNSSILDWNAPDNPASSGDVNGNNKVSIVDFSIVVNRFGTRCP